MAQKAVNAALKTLMKAVTTKTAKLAKGPESDTIDAALQEGNAKGLGSLVNFAKRVSLSQAFAKAGTYAQKIPVTTLFKFASYFGFKPLFRLVFSKFGAVILVTLAVVVYKTFYATRQKVKQKDKRQSRRLGSRDYQPVPEQSPGESPTADDGSSSDQEG